MITVAVPDQEVADAIGALDDGRIVLWDPSEGPAPEDERENINLVCIPHLTGGRTVYGRIAECPAVKVIQIPSAGYEHAEPFVPVGTALANARDVHHTRTAEMALTLALVSQRRLPAMLDAQRRGTWEPDHYAPSLADKRCLVVGYGSIGAAIGARLRACEADVTGVARTARTAPDGTVVHAMADLPGLLPDANVVFIVTPLTDATEGLVDADFLAALPNDALLVNVARGKVVDTDALLAELKTGRLRAALDVTDPEPLPDGHSLWSAPGCVIMPHVAGFAQLTDKRYVALVKRQVASLLRGEGGVNIVVRR